MRVKNKVKGQGATEYLLMLAAVLIIVAVAIYYVTRAGGYPVVAVTAANSENMVRLNVETGEIAAGEWQYCVKNTSGTPYSWVDGPQALKAPWVDLGPYAAGTWYISLRHKGSGHIYFADRAITIE